MDNGQEIIQVMFGITPKLLTRSQVEKLNQARQNGEEYVTIDGLELPTHHNGQISAKELELNEKLKQKRWLCLWGAYHYRKLEDITGIPIITSEGTCYRQCPEVTKEMSQARFVKRRLLDLQPGTELTARLNKIALKAKKEAIPALVKRELSIIKLPEPTKEPTLTPEQVARQEEWHKKQRRMLIAELAKKSMRAVEDTLMRFASGEHSRANGKKVSDDEIAELRTLTEEVQKTGQNE